MATRVTKSLGRQAALAALVVHMLAAARVAAAGDESNTARPASPKLAERAAGAKAGPPVARRIVVSIPDCKLALIENDRVVRVYSIAVGAEESPTPVGTFTIVNRITNPTYYHPGTVIPPGESNPLGTRWMGLNAKGFGIHGTDTPS